MIDESKLLHVLEHLYEGVYFLDIDKKVTYWNKGAETITGYSYSEVVNKLHCYDIFKSISKEGVDNCTLDCKLFKTLLNAPFFEERKVFLRHKEGHQIPVSVRAIPLKDDIGTMIGAIKLFNDCHPKEYLEKELREFRDLAMIDQLTGLKNRRYAENQLNTKLVELRSDDLPFGILFFDIDHFKVINDSYGHKVGDLVLQMLSKTLMNNTRPSDVIIRWGGEEIVAVLVGSIDATKLNYVANKLRVLVEKSSITIDGKPLNITVSVGATLARCDDDIDSLMNRADQLMYLSKNDGRNCVTLG